MTKAKAESKDHKSQTHRHIFTTTTINSRLFLVAFECKTNFHSIALSHLPVPLSSCLPVWLSPCLFVLLSLSAAALAPCQSSRSGVAVPTASGQQQQQQQRHGNNSTSSTHVWHPIHTLLTAFPPQLRLPTDHSHW